MPEIFYPSKPITILLVSNLLLLFWLGEFMPKFFSLSESMTISDVSPHVLQCVFLANLSNQWFWCSLRNMSCNVDSYSLCFFWIAQLSWAILLWSSLAKFSVQMLMYGWQGELGVIQLKRAEILVQYLIRLISSEFHFFNMKEIW